MFEFDRIFKNKKSRKTASERLPNSSLGRGETFSDDQETQLKRNIELLRSVETDLVVYRKGVLEELLQETPVRISVSEAHPLDTESFVVTKSTDRGVLHTSAENPFLLFEEMASFCSLLVSVDANGNAVLLHKALISPHEDMSPDERDIRKSLERYKELLKGLESQRVNLFTGTNVMTDLRRSALDRVRTFFGTNEPFSTLFTDPVPNQHSNIFTDKVIDGIVVIPKQYTKDGRTKIVLVGEELESNAREDLLNISSRRSH